MRDWIYRIVRVFPGPLRSVGEAVADAIFGTWDEIGNVFRLIRAIWLHIWSGAHGLLWALHGYALEVYGLLRNIIINRIPDFAHWALSTALEWASDAISFAVNGLRATINAVQSWVSDSINVVRNLALSILSWANQRINELWENLSWVLVRVEAFLTNPVRLVDWILAPLIEALLRWAVANGERLAELAWANRERLAFRTLQYWETIVRRLL